MIVKINQVCSENVQLYNNSVVVSKRTKENPANNKSERLDWLDSVYYYIEKENKKCDRKYRLMKEHKDRVGNIVN